MTLKSNRNYPVPESNLTSPPGGKTVAFNSARFLTSASRVEQCPPDYGIEVAFAGRSNAGKSSAINTITANGKLARTSKTPGRTRLINFFSLNRPDCRLVDLPGYGYARVSKEMQEDWRKHLDDYLTHRESLQGMVLVMDVRHPLSDFDHMMIEWCEQSALPLMILATKADKLKSGQLKQTVREVQGALADKTCVQHLIAFSATRKQGLEEARLALKDWLEAEASQQGDDQ